MLSCWKIITLCAFLVCCRNTKPSDVQPKEKDRYTEAVDRLFDEFMVDGQVVSKTKDGKPHGEGDSLLFTGLALGSIPCERVNPILSTLRKMQVAHFGYLVRFHPLSEGYSKGNQVSFDGLTGALFGLWRVFKNCPQKEIAKRIFSDLYTNLKTADWVIYPGHSHPLVESKIYAVKRYTFKLAAHEILGEKKPSFAERVAFENAMVAWVYATKVSKHHCFRVHLANIHLLLIKEQQKTRELFCEHTKQMALPLTDWYCGRDHFINWVNSFRYDVYEYRHQRCPYEGIDGKGFGRPAVDYILLIKLMRELQDGYY